MLARHLNAIGAPGRSNCRGHDEYKGLAAVVSTSRERNRIRLRPCPMTWRTTQLHLPTHAWPSHVLPTQAARCIGITFAACACSFYVLPMAVQCKLCAQHRLPFPPKTSFRSCSGLVCCMCMARLVYFSHHRELQNTCKPAAQQPHLKQNLCW